jgi:O-glycosyl hydrolase
VERLKAWLASSAGSPGSTQLLSNLLPAEGGVPQTPLRASVNTSAEHRVDPSRSHWISSQSRRQDMARSRLLDRQSDRAHFIRRNRSAVLSTMVLSGIMAAVASAASAQVQPAEEAAAPARAVQPITIDGRNGGRRFDGLGAVSAGASTRLLLDYPEPARSDILDYLFKPNYGAGLQILKVEIGSDVNATDGSEPSHMRTRDDLNFNRGYEWWLMKEAVARNPDIVLAALQWGAPGWLEGGFWSQDNVDYVMKWLDGAKQHGLKIDYAGGWNESGYEAEWFVLLDKALREQHPDVGIIAPDDLPHHNWRIAGDMADNPEVNAAIDVLGQHSPGGWRSLYQKYSSTEEARRLGKPLWVSEQSSLSHDVGGRAWARGINRAYVDAKITASINWAPVAAWYPILPHADTGLLLAEWPWSGHYRIGSGIWVYAHTTQFAQPGWQYIDSACGYLDTGASYVTLKSPEGGDFSIVIETLDAEAPSQVQFTVRGGLKDETVHLWSSNLATEDAADDFVHAETIRPRDGIFTVTLRPGHLYSISTTTGQSKGDARPPSEVAEQMRLPYAEDFEGSEHGRLVRYFSDVNGGFETAPAGGGRQGTVYRQVVPAQPITWHLAGGAGVAPTTMLGDPRWWGDYEIRADVLLEQEGYVELIGRLSAQAGQEFAGYHLRFSSDGTWQLYSQDLENVRETDVEIASGRAPFAAGRWHSLALRMQGNQIAAVLDGEVVGTATDTRHTVGNVGLRVSGWQHAQFDNVKITPTAAPPRFVAQDEMTVTATSEHDRFYRGDVFNAAYLIDGRPESFWHSGFDPRIPLPQSVTLDLGRTREVHALTYQPRADNQADGMITRYNVYLSTDGQAFTKIAEGKWPIGTATKIANWPARQARYVRLEALEGVNNVATGAEINVSTTPIPASRDN